MSESPPAASGGSHGSVWEFGHHSGASVTGLGNKTHRVFKLMIDGNLEPVMLDLPIYEMVNGVAPSYGDDLKPPNAVDLEDINMLSILPSCSAGWTVTPPKEKFYPCSVSYRINVLQAARDLPSVEVEVAVEFENPFPDESMMVRMQMYKTTVSGDHELELVRTSFQDMADGQWVNIDTDIAYNATANAVVDSVVSESESGQTAGTAESRGNAVEVKLGPIGERGRILLFYRVHELNSYDAMDMTADGSNIGTHKLIPLGITLPWADIFDEAGLTTVHITFCAPDHIALLSVDSSPDAYAHLKHSNMLRNTCLIAVQELRQVLNQPGCVGFEHGWSSLPVRPTTVLFWLAVRNHRPSTLARMTEGEILSNAEGFDVGRSSNGVGSGSSSSGSHSSGSSVSSARKSVMVTASPIINRHRESFDTVFDDKMKEKGHGTIMVPNAKDMRCLTDSMPDHGPDVTLLRIAVTVPQQKLNPDMTRLLIHLTISDASSSTGVSFADKETIRSSFTKFEEQRLLQRLKSVHLLVKEGLVRPHDIWVETFFVFCHHCFGKFYYIATVQDILALDMQKVLDTARNTSVQYTANQPAIGMVRVDLAQLFAAIRCVQPGGGTSFQNVVQSVLEAHNDIMRSAEKHAKMGSRILKTSFVEFDTDGGNSTDEFGSSDHFFRLLDAMIQLYEVRNGVVLGFGQWVNQGCASEIAKRIGSSPSFLSLHPPKEGKPGYSRIFRVALKSWIDAVRAIPTILRIGAGAVTCVTPNGEEKSLNALEVLAVDLSLGTFQPRFGQLDVSEMAFVNSVIENVVGGSKILLYVASRIGNMETLKGSLRINALGDPNPIVTVMEPEHLQHESLGYHWLKVLTHSSPSRQLIYNGNILVPHLRSRLEDAVSFKFEIVSPSGATAFLGRAKTEPHLAIDKHHQPEPPLDLRTAGRFGLANARKATLSNSLAMETASTTSSTAPQMAGYIPVGIDPVTGNQILAFGPGGTAGVGTPSGSGGGQGFLPGYVPGPRNNNLPNQQQQSGMDTNAYHVQMDYPQAKLGGSMQSHPPRGAFQRARMGNQHLASNDRATQTFSIPGPSQGASHWMELLNNSLFCRFGVRAGNIGQMQDVVCGLMDKSVFTCDVCGNVVKPTQWRNHCLDCDDFDECENCSGYHIYGEPYHRVQSRGSRDKNISANHKHEENEDPLVYALLGAAGLTCDVCNRGISNGEWVNSCKTCVQEYYECQKCAGSHKSKYPSHHVQLLLVKEDETNGITHGITDWHEVLLFQRARRFLRAFLDWWPLIRSLFGDPAMFALDLDRDTTIHISEALGNDTGEKAPVLASAVERLLKVLLASDFEPFKYSFQPDGRLVIKTERNHPYSW